MFLLHVRFMLGLKMLLFQSVKWMENGKKHSGI